MKVSTRLVLAEVENGKTEITFASDDVQAAVLNWDAVAKATKPEDYSVSARVARHLHDMKPGAYKRLLASKVGVSYRNASDQLRLMPILKWHEGQYPKESFQPNIPSA